jgi:hypothetical protein
LEAEQEGVMDDYERRAGRTELVVRCAETFDATTARDVFSSLRGMPSDECVVLDFGQARNVDYYGLLALAGEISHASMRIRLRGLDDRHVRMLRYFGLDPAAFGVCEASNTDVASEDQDSLR